MNVRIDYQPTGRPGGGRRRKPRPARRRGWTLAMAAGGGLLLVVALLTFRPGPGAGADDGTTKPGGGASATRSAVEMKRGGATGSAALATRSVAGLPRGFPSSEAGAVEAGAAFVASVYDLHRMPAAERWSYVQDAMTDPPPKQRLDTDAVAFRANHRLAETGEVLDVSGEAVPGVGFTSRCHPELGAYRVEDFETGRAEVDYWMPCLLGTVDEVGQAIHVQTRWQMGRMTLRWHRDDWRVDELARGPSDEPVTPPDEGEPATTLAERAALLGAGWLAFADASERRPAEAESAAPR
ncbi:hypothetical protein [Streptomyces millisiae]|uniref:Integral membrane protein n=1 Tax=Streptomyces millisiae TaxID=3075542 RepID=A0ABU2LNX9_9ACTN|nr:hypothetical protein [Streptomyces sp. DSM 44918]MDT0319299.1 hypothetical protein [Streptomyces sp. DSM 44918]